MNIPRAVWNWLDDRTGINEAIKPIAEHPVPPDTGWLYVFGSATLFAFILQVATGIALATSYVSSAGQAYDSLQFISNDTFGRVLRGMHYFGASAMVLLIGLHMVRVFLTGAYKFPREVNWLTGGVLLLVTLVMAFTGQLLRWDQNAVWSVVVAAQQAGRVPLVGKFMARFLIAGDTVGGATLSRFFSFHVFFVPAIIFLFLGIHLALVLRNGISEPAEAGQPVDPKTYRQRYEGILKERGVPFWPDAAWRDVMAGMAMIVVVAILALIIGPPVLGKPPDPTIIQAYPRPDWYLLWYFAVLALIPPGLEPYVIVLGPTLLGIGLLLLPFLSNRGERHPLRRPWAMGTVLVVVMMIGILWYIGDRSPWSPDFTTQPLPASAVGTTTGPVAQGATLFYQKGCQNCHTVDGQGGTRGPNLSAVGNRLTTDQMTIRILNGGTNMPAYAGTLSPDELDALVAFLHSRGQ